MAVCENFPGVWDERAPGGTCRVWRQCACAGCVAEWPCPVVRAADIIEVASHLGVYPARVVRYYVDLDNEGRERVNVDIESDDPAAPEYLRKKVHAKWTLTVRSCRWRLYNVENPWRPAPVLTRFDRVEVGDVLDG